MVYNQNRQQNYSNQNNQPIEAKQIPGNYVDQAEIIMQEIIYQGPKITTSKIRNLLSLIIDIYNTENLRTESALKEESIAQLQMARIRMIYESGRDKPTKNLVEKA
ncbi:MAG: type III-A CRISPR-associated protein Csm2, partial [Eubacteriaceae bacterium]